MENTKKIIIGLTIISIILIGIYFLNTTTQIENNFICFEDFSCKKISLEDWLK